MINSIQKNVTVKMERTDKIKEIIFPDKNYFYIIWKDGTKTRYSYKLIGNIFKQS